MAIIIHLLWSQNGGSHHQKLKDKAMNETKAPWYLHLFDLSLTLNDVIQKKKKNFTHAEWLVWFGCIDPGCFAGLVSGVSTGPLLSMEPLKRILFWSVTFESNPQAQLLGILNMFSLLVAILKASGCLSLGIIIVKVAIAHLVQYYVHCWGPIMQLYQPLLIHNTVLIFLY